MNNLFDFLDEPQELAAKKMTRILVIPNITFAKNLEQDSYVQVLKNMITELSKIRDDLFWYILSPKEIKSLKFPNTVQYDWELPTYPPAMRADFDVTHFTKLMGNDIDIDIVMSHLPEHTWQVVNTLYNVTHHKPKVFGYTHWFDFTDIMVWEKGAFNQNILGLLEYDRCYINTQAQKDKVLNQAKYSFNYNTIKRLDSILTVQHLGVQEGDIQPQCIDPDKTIVFNHRPDTYKHYPEFVKLMERLWKIRQDFKVWVPLAAKPTHEWMYCDKFPKEEYYDHLRECCVGFSPEQTYCGWSVSTTDGLMNGVPYIMFDAPYYKELWEDGDKFSNDNEALELLDKYLDEPEYRNEMGYEAIKHMRKNLLYKDKMVEMSEYMDNLVNSSHVRNSQKTKELIEIIRKEGRISKIDLFKNHCGWGRGIKWTAYRRALMNHPNIFDQEGPVPYYIWSDS